MKRTKSLVASILGTIANAVQVVINLIGFFAVITLLSFISEGTSSEEQAVIIFMVLIMVVLILVLITALVLSCVTFGYINGSHEKWTKRRGVTITTIVFNFLVVGLLLFSLLISTEVSALDIVFNIITMGMIIAANVLYIIDLATEERKVKKLNEQKTEVSTTETTQENVVENKEEKEV